MFAVLVRMCWHLKLPLEIIKGSQDRIKGLVGKIKGSEARMIDSTINIAF